MSSREDDYGRSLAGNERMVRRGTVRPSHHKGHVRADVQQLARPIRVSLPYLRSYTYVRWCFQFCVIFRPIRRQPPIVKARVTACLERLCSAQQYQEDRGQVTLFQMRSILFTALKQRAAHGHCSLTCLSNITHRLQTASCACSQRQTAQYILARCCKTTAAITSCGASTTFLLFSSERLSAADTAVVPCTGWPAERRTELFAACSSAFGELRTILICQYTVKVDCWTA